MIILAEINKIIQLIIDVNNGINSEHLRYIAVHEIERKINYIIRNEKEVLMGLLDYPIFVDYINFNENYLICEIARERKWSDVTEKMKLIYNKSNNYKKIARFFLEPYGGEIATEKIIAKYYNLKYKKANYWEWNLIHKEIIRRHLEKIETNNDILLKKTKEYENKLNKNVLILQKD